jgi:monothiol glutaredoxin
MRACCHIATLATGIVTRKIVMSIEVTIKDQIANNPILIYMKGNPNQPQCGFSARASQMLMACGQKFAYVDILGNPEIRANLPKVSDWPTFPQLFVDGELVGGCDIMSEMFESGELKTLLDASAAKREQA